MIMRPSDLYSGPYCGELWHGVGSPEAWGRILKGDSLKLGVAHTHDVGDYGLAVYLTRSLARAECYAVRVDNSPTVVRAQVTLKNAVVLDWRAGSALDLDHPATQQLAQLVELYGDPVVGAPEEREAAATRWRAGMLDEGFDGVVVLGTQDTEVAVYEPNIAIGPLTPMALKPL